MKFKSWPAFKLRRGRCHAWRSCPIFGCLKWQTHSSDAREPRAMQQLEDSEPVPGPSGLQQAPRTAQGSDGRVQSSKRKREDVFDIEQERAAPSKKCRSESPENSSDEEPKRSRGLPLLTPARPETVSEEEGERNWEVLLNKYDFVANLSSGGYGVVYAGRRIADNFLVAIKIIKVERVPFVEMEVDGVMRTLPKEVALLIRLGAGPENSSCRITPLLLDWYHLSDEIALILEKPSPCKDLLHYVVSEGSQGNKVEKAKIIIRQLVDQAIEMEEKGVFHRDIKPGNVLIEVGSDVPRARFIDFGCATSYTSPEEKFIGPQGTIAYGSPEWFRHSPYTARGTTVWQLGLVLYYLLFHKRPLVTVKAIASKRAVPIPRSVPKDCRKLLKGCLDKDPNTRFTLEEIRNHPWLRPE